jgi:hypothetical protein
MCQLLPGIAAAIILLVLFDVALVPVELPVTAGCDCRLPRLIEQLPLT